MKWIIYEFDNNILRIKLDCKIEWKNECLMRNECLIRNECRNKMLIIKSYNNIKIIVWNKINIQIYVDWINFNIKI